MIRKEEEVVCCLILERCDKGFSVLFLIHDAIIALGLAVACFMHTKKTNHPLTNEHCSLTIPSLPTVN